MPSDLAHSLHLLESWQSKRPHSIRASSNTLSTSITAPCSAYMLMRLLLTKELDFNTLSNLFIHTPALFKCCYASTCIQNWKHEMVRCTPFLLHFSMSFLLLSFHMFHTSHNHDSPGSHIACGPPVKHSLCMLCDPTFWIYVYEAATTKHQTHDHFESQVSEKNPWWSFSTIPSWPVMNSRNCSITYSLFIPCIPAMMLLIL